MKKSFFFIIVILFLSICVFSNNYHISSFSLENIIFPDGSMQVYEKFEYKLDFNYRGLSRYLPKSRYVTIEDLKIWTEGLPVMKNDFSVNNEREFNVSVWLVPYESPFKVDYKRFPKIVLNIMYTAKYVVEDGVDCSQLFRQFWGSGWEVPVNNVEVKFVFPSNIIPNQYYIHADFENIVTFVGNVFTLKAEKIPAYTYGEVRFVFDAPTEEEYTVKNISLSKEVLEKVENEYKEQKE